MKIVFQALGILHSRSLVSIYCTSAWTNPSLYLPGYLWSQDHGALDAFVFASSLLHVVQYEIGTQKHVNERLRAPSEQWDWYLDCRAQKEEDKRKPNSNVIGQGGRCFI